MQLQIGVKVLIKNNNGLYLFLKRSKLLSSDVKNSWDIPGGRINPAENLHDALVREVSEEIHHDLENEPTLVNAQDIFISAKSLHVVRLTYITTEDVSDIILSDEHEDYVWRSLDDLDDLNIEPYLKEVLDTLDSGNA
jgi:8-oxo-dGTP diphosphatase